MSPSDRLYDITETYLNCENLTDVFHGSFKPGNCGLDRCDTAACCSFSFNSHDVAIASFSSLALRRLSTLNFPIILWLVPTMNEDTVNLRA
jgi:hypothetical protein